MIPSRTFTTVLTTCLVLLAGLAVSPAQAARKIHLVVAADTQDPQLEKYSEADAEFVRTLFISHVAEGELEIAEVSGERLTKAGLLQEISNLAVSPEDAIVFYYTGHGAFAKNDQHFFVAKSGQEWISRTALIQALRGRGAGLTVLLTDACANFSSLAPEERKQFAESFLVAKTAPLFRKLFFQTNGFVDVNSCRKDQVALTSADPTEGSIFTASFVQVCKQNLNAEFGWDEILTRTAKETAARFKQVCGEGQEITKSDGSLYVQTTQTVARNALEVVAFTPQTGSGAEPSEPGMTRTESQVIRIDPRTGSVFEIAVTLLFDPATATGKLVMGAPRLIGQAKLEIASNGTKFFRYTSWRSCTVKADLVVRAENNNNSGLGPIGQRLGVSVRPANGGVQIAAVVPGGPSQRGADKTGKVWKLESGDLITEVNGVAVSTVAEFSEAIRSSPREATLRVSDGQKSMTLWLTLNDMPAGEVPAPQKGVRFGVAVVERADGTGVEVKSVLAKSPATRLRDGQGRNWRLEPGDVILRINGRDIGSDAELAAALDESPQTMLVQVRGTDGSVASFAVTLNN